MFRNSCRNEAGAAAPDSVGDPDRAPVRVAVVIGSPTEFAEHSAKVDAGEPALWPVQVRFRSEQDLAEFIRRKSEVPSFMTVAEYADHRGLCKRTVEERILDGMPLEGRGRWRRVDVAAADQWFRQQGHHEDPRSMARAAALKAVEEDPKP